MKFLGADIRIIDIPKATVLELVRDFIASHQPDIEKDEELNTAVTHIRAIHMVHSYLKFWWKGTPQVIDWKITKYL